MNRFFAGKASVQEANELAEWIGDDESRKAEFKKAFRLFLLTNLAITSPEYKAKAAQLKARKQRVWTRTAVALAAAAALAIGVIITHLVAVKPANELIETSTLVSEAKPGSQTTITLSDGTVVELNSGSRLEYPAIFGKGNREVRLTGEALFTVKHNEDHPFIVNTDSYNVKVLGTKFNVEACGNEFTTSLLSGRVAITNKEGETELLLEPNQTASLKDGKLQMSTSEGDEVLWTQGIISAAGLSFDELMRRMERSYGVRIVIDSEEIPEMNYGYLKLRVSNGIEHAFKVLQTNTDFTYTYDETTNTYHINH